MYVIVDQCEDTVLTHFDPSSYAKCGWDELNEDELVQEPVVFNTEQDADVVRKQLIAMLVRQGGDEQELEEDMIIVAVRPVPPVITYSLQYTDSQRRP